MTVDLSVIMSVYNGDAYLREAVESILSQTYKAFEFIIIDDASNDNTFAILAEYEKQDPRVKVQHNKENIGLTRSLNKGIASAKGQYIARMDADDISLPFRLEKQIAFLKTHLETGVLGSAVELIDAGGQVIGQRIYPTDSIIIRWRLAFENPLCHPAVLVRRELLQAHQYDPNLDTAQDYELWCRLVGKTKLANLPETLLRFRKHGENLTYRKGKQQRENSLKTSSKYIENITLAPILDEVVRSLWERQNLPLEQSQQISIVMHSLARAILMEARWSDTERKILSRYAARWIVDRVRNRLANPLVWRVLWRAIKLDPVDFANRLLAWFWPRKDYGIYN
jgi:hypothetical protein